MGFIIAQCMIVGAFAIAAAAIAFPIGYVVGVGMLGHILELHDEDATKRERAASNVRDVAVAFALGCGFIAGAARFAAVTYWIWTSMQSRGGIKDPASFLYACMGGPEPAARQLDFITALFGLVGHIIDLNLCLLFVPLVTIVLAPIVGVCAAGVALVGLHKYGAAFGAGVSELWSFHFSAADAPAVAMPLFPEHIPADGPALLETIVVRDVLADMGMPVADPRDLDQMRAVTDRLDAESALADAIARREVAMAQAAILRELNAAPLGTQIQMLQDLLERENERLRTSLAAHQPGRSDDISQR